MTNIKEIVRSFPLTDVSKPKKIETPTLPWLGSFYTKTEVDNLIKEAVAEARRIDEEERPSSSPIQWVAVPIP